MNEDIHAKGSTPDPFNPGVLIAYSEHSRADWTNQFYGQYSHGPLQLEAEYRRYVRDQLIFAGASENPLDVRGWYASGTYRLVKRVEIGAYYSHYTVQSFLKGGARVSRSGTNAIKLAREPYLRQSCCWTH